jgi:hypothetical protein
LRPPQPLTAAPKPKKSQKEIEGINLRIRREIWPDSDFRMPALWRRRGDIDLEIPGQYPHDLARNARGFDHVFWKLRNNQFTISSGLLDSGIAAGTFHLLREQDFSLDRIHCDQLHSENRQDDGPPKLDPKLCKALRESAERTGVPLKPELETAISKAEDVRAKAKERESQLEKQKDQSKTKEVRIDLEPQ